MSELLNSGQVGNCLGDVDDFERKWEGTGLIDYVDSEHKGKLAYLFEIMAFYLITGHKFESFGERVLMLEKVNNFEKDLTEYDRFHTIAFPVILRVFRGYDFKLFNVFNIEEHYNETIGSVSYEDLKKINDTAYNTIDAEAEMCAWFSEYYLKLLKRRSLKRKLLLENKKYMVKAFKNFLKNY